MSKEVPFFSIIIPAYNAEQTIDKMVFSLKKQYFQNFELIIVNDGSVDGTGRVLNKLKDDYSNILTFDKSNGGVSSARNYGLKMSQGRYVLFLDADDSVEPELLQEVYVELEKNNFMNDVIIFGKQNVKDNGSVASVNVPLSVHAKSIDSELFDELLKVNLLPTMYNKVVRKEFIGNIKFKKMSVGEDFQFVLDIFDKNPIVSFISKPLYTYHLETKNSIMQSYNKDRLNNFISQKNQILNFIMNHLNNSGKYEIIVNNVNVDTLDRIVTNLFRKQGRRGFLSRFKELRQANRYFPVDFKCTSLKYNKSKTLKLKLAKSNNLFSFVFLSALYLIKKV